MKKKFLLALLLSTQVLPSIAMEGDGKGSSGKKQTLPPLTEVIKGITNATIQEGKGPAKQTSLMGQIQQGIHTGTHNIGLGPMEKLAKALSETTTLPGIDSLPNTIQGVQLPPIKTPTVAPTKTTQNPPRQTHESGTVTNALGSLSIGQTKKNTGSSLPSGKMYPKGPTSGFFFAPPQTITTGNNSAPSLVSQYGQYPANAVGNPQTTSGLDSSDPFRRPEFSNQSAVKASNNPNANNVEQGNIKVSNADATTPPNSPQTPATPSGFTTDEEYPNGIPGIQDLKKGTTKKK